MGSFAWMRVLESSAQRYDLGMRWLSLGRMGAVYRAVAEAATSGRTAPQVLDVGCGTGGVALACAERGAEVVAIDRDAGMLAVARSKPPPAGGVVRWLELGALEIEDQFGPESFDAVVSCLALSEMSDAEQTYLLSVARTRLVPGGRLVVADEVRPRGLWGRIVYAVLRAPVVGLAYLVTQAATRPVTELPRKAREAGFADVDEVRRWGGAFAIVTASAPKDAVQAEAEAGEATPGRS